MGGKKIVLATSPGELSEPFTVWVDGKKKKGFSNRGEVADYLIKDQGISPELAHQKAGAMKPGQKIVIDAEDSSKH